MMNPLLVAAVLMNPPGLCFDQDLKIEVSQVIDFQMVHVSFETGEPVRVYVGGYPDVDEKYSDPRSGPAPGTFVDMGERGFLGRTDADILTYVHIIGDSPNAKELAKKIRFCKAP